MTLATLLADLAGGILVASRADAVLAAMMLTFPGGRGVLLIERQYRDGLRAITDPTATELETLRSGNLWDLWNSERATMLDGIA